MSRPEEIAAALGKATKEGRGWKSLCPSHDDHEPSLSIDEKDGKILIKCRAGCDQDAVIAALSKRGLWRNGADHSNGADGKQHVVATYYYHAENSDVLYRVLKWGPKKTFVQQPPDGNGGWRKGKGAMEGVRLVPYRLPQLLAARANGTPPRIYIVEGEKDADRLAQWGLIATTNVGGAGKWHGQIYNEYFIGSAAVVILDNDKPGRKHAEAVAQNLLSIAADVRILDLPGLPSKGDVSDWVAAGGTREDLERLADNAPLFQPGQSTPKSDNEDNRDDELDDAAVEAEISRLARLSKLKYERERADAAKRLKLPASRLDRLVSAERDIDADDSAASKGLGRPLEFPEVEPWSEVIDGAILFDEMAATIRRYIVLSQGEADAAALWVVGTHCFDAWVVFPRLFATSADRNCGKSTFLDVIYRLVPKPLSASNINAAGLFRAIEMARPTMLLDEADAYARENEDLRSVLDSGHHRRGEVVRNVVINNNHEPRLFSTWAPVALAAIGHLEGTVENRSIFIRLRRRRSDEPITSLRLDRVCELDELCRKVARWAEDNIDALAAADPVLPPSLINRLADNWRSLFAIAEAVGGNWKARAEQALAESEKEKPDEDNSIRTALLADIWDAFTEKDKDRDKIEEFVNDRMTSEDLVKHLTSLEHRPWPEWGKQRKPITKIQVAALLRPLKISPGTIQLTPANQGKTFAKGYLREAFADAFARYLLRASPFSKRQPSAAAENLAESESRNVSGNFAMACDAEPLTFLNSKNPSNSAVADGLTFREGGILGNCDADDDEDTATWTG